MQGPAGPSDDFAPDLTSATGRALGRRGGRGTDVALFIVAGAGAVRGLIDQPNVAGFCTVGPLGQVAVAPCFTRDENLAPGMPP